MVESEDVGVTYPRSQGEGKPGYEARGDTLMVGHGTVTCTLFHSQAL